MLLLVSCLCAGASSAPSPCSLGLIAGDLWHGLQKIFDRLEIGCIAVYYGMTLALLKHRLIYLVETERVSCGVRRHSEKSGNICRQ
jgi:hypothetical protein